MKSKKRGTIEIRKSKNKEVYVKIKSTNGENLAHTETYKRKQNATKVIKAIKKVVQNGKVVDKTKLKKKR